jgi:mRNA interferase YafQ
MKKIFPSTRYKKDYKRYKNNPKKVEALKEVIKLLKNEQPIPAEYQPHMLHGKYQGCMECHIQGDFLLIWIDPDTDIIELVRLGSHSELFNK